MFRWRNKEFRLSVASRAAGEGNAARYFQMVNFVASNQIPNEGLGCEGDLDTGRALGLGKRFVNLGF